MSDTLDFRRLLHTPFRDLARGRVTGRLDVRRNAMSAGLPAAASELILRVVRRTRLSRGEKIEVADELIAHFADGLAAGTPVETLIRDFGDERAVAKLIRRSKKRNRGLLWHGAKYALRVALVIVAIDALLFTRFFIGKASVSVDYISQLNAPNVRVPANDRAWPIYRQAAIKLGLGKQSDPALEQKLADDTARSFSEARPTDREWPTLVAWLDAHRQGLDEVRSAAAKPGLGFLLGPGGSAYDPELGLERTQGKVLGENGPESSLDQSLAGVLLPDLNILARMGKLLSADAVAAREQSDATRVVHDVEAMLGITRQLRDAEAVIVTRLVGLRVGHFALREVRETLARKPELLSDDDLIRLAHRISASTKGATASAFYDITGERMSFKDIVQRMYTDDGRGDGRLARSAVRTISDLNLLTAGQNSRPPQPNDASDVAKFAVVGSVVATLDTRRALEEEHQRLSSLIESDLMRPLYAIDPAHSGNGAVQHRLDEIGRSTVDRVKLGLLLFLTPTFTEAQKTAERFIGERDGTLVALALELHRRRHGGAYPATLDELMPMLLPAMPKDRITGEPIRYRLVEGKPVVYSVGIDRDDDAGRAAVNPKTHAADPDIAARWLTGNKPDAVVDGDWILFDARADASPAISTQPLAD